MDEVNGLRKQLEDKNYKGSKAFYDNLTTKHKALLGAEPISPKVFLEGRLFLNGFCRIVTGAHGPYVEFDKSHLALPIETKGERHIKYHSLCPVGYPNVKIYLQTREVKYADYRVGKYYVDYWICGRGDTK